MFISKILRKRWWNFTFRPCFSFIELDKNAQRAVLACKIIDKIINAKEEDDYYIDIEDNKFS